MISQEKIERLKEINNDDSDFILKINEYVKHEHTYIEQAEVFENIETLKERLYQKEQGISTLYLLFSEKEYNSGDLNFFKVENIESEAKSIEEQYYPNSKYTDKIEKIKAHIEKNLEGKINDIVDFDVIVDISSVSGYPLWNTKMRRHICSILKNVEEIAIENLDEHKLAAIIRDSDMNTLGENSKYDIDLLIQYLIALDKIGTVNVYIIDSQKTNETIFMTNEITKMAYVLNLKQDQKYTYIYDTICKDMDEMFSKYGFCNFKNNKCVAQRHKTLFNRYPVPSTDGCCFKVVRKCQHNNRDGSCKIKCLPCKLFKCPYLSQFNIGTLASELILIRAFLNNKQRHIVVHDFYKSEEILLEKLKNRE